MFGAKLIIGLYAADFVLFCFTTMHILYIGLCQLCNIIYGKTLMHDLDFV